MGSRAGARFAPALQTQLATTSKYLAQSNKSSDGGQATKKRCSHFRTNGSDED